MKVKKNFQPKVFGSGCGVGESEVRDGLCHTQTHTHTHTQQQEARSNGGDEIVLFVG